MKIYQVDAFTDQLFGGNPAAVVPLTEWLPDATLRNIAAENNLAETAFYVPSTSATAHYHLRWFTPETEVDLCGHVILASAFIFFYHENFTEDEIRFASKSGLLTVTKSGDMITLDFPSYTITPVEVTNDVLDAMGKVPSEAFKMNNDLLLVYNDEHIL